MGLKVVKMGMDVTFPRSRNITPGLHISIAFVRHSYAPITSTFGGESRVMRPYEAIMSISPHHQHLAGRIRFSAEEGLAQVSVHALNGVEMGVDMGLTWG